MRRPLVLTAVALSLVACGDKGASGAVTSVSAAPGTPISISGTTAPVLSMRAATAAASGYLDAADWSRFDAKLPAPPAACAAGDFLGWNGASTACAAVPVYAAGAGLTMTGTDFSINFTPPGGRNGAAATVARGDHSHAIYQTVPLSSLQLRSGVTLGVVPLSADVTMSTTALSVAANAPAFYAVSGTATMPVGLSPALRLTLRNPGATTQTYSIGVLSVAVVAGAVKPDTYYWLASIPVTINAGQTAVVERTLLAQLMAFSCYPSCPSGGPGDLVWFSFGPDAATSPAFDVLAIQLVY